MMSTKHFLIIAACLAMVANAAPAAAQSPDSNVSFQSGLLQKKAKAAGLPDVKAQPLAWPRLDAGAVLCRSEADLIRLAQRRSGEAVDGAVDCQIIRLATPITIVQRNGPGRTEVKPSESQPMDLGWTDAWLPDKAPTRATSASR
jgi:hypothetical protein